MSGALCYKSCCRHLLRLLFVSLCLVLLMPRSCSGGRINRSAFLDDNAQVRSVVVDPNNRTIWSMFNLTDAQVRFIQNRTNPNNQDETTQTSSHRHLQHVASRRVNEIFNLIRNAVTNQSDGTTNRDSLGASATQTHGQKTLHEKAGFPICNAETSILNWQQSTNVTLQFASSIFQRSAGDSLSLDSALLRLYKIDPNNKSAAEPTATAETTICPEPDLLDSQIRVTVSIVHQQKKKQRKKRTCNTVMLSSSKIGWVDIDVKCALNYWEQQQCQHSHSPLPASVVGMLMIEVHDDEENQLKPGLYFEQPKCDQADPAVPWTVYGAKTPLPCMENRTMPRYPRLDVRFTGDAQFVSLAGEESESASESKDESSLSNNSSNNSSTIDNTLDADNLDTEVITEYDRLDLQPQQHRRRHNHSHRETTSPVHHHHHHHNQYNHHHHKHHHVLAHKQQQQQQQQQQQE